MIDKSIGLTLLLTILFIVLKVTEYITWSWLWILSPIWIYFGLIVVITIVLILVVTLSARYRGKLIYIIYRYLLEY